MQKKLFTLVLMLIAAINTFAYDFESNGIYYKILSKKKCTCAVTNQSETSSKKYAGNIVIPSTVQDSDGVDYTVSAISNFAFQDCVKLQNVVLPNTIQSVGQQAFENCVLLESIVLPKSVTTLGYYSFNAIKSPMVAYYYLMWRKQTKGLNNKEKNILGEIISNQLIKRLNQTEEELKKMGLSLRKLGEKYPQKFSLLFDKIAHFHEIRYNVSGKHLLYCNFDTFLHVYLRHVKELKVDNQFGDRDKFQLKEENVMDVMGHVMRSLNDEYQLYKEQNPNGRFFRKGAMAYYYNGDYYNVVVNADGSISTFYKGSGDKQ